MCEYEPSMFAARRLPDESWQLITPVDNWPCRPQWRTSVVRARHTTLSTDRLPNLKPIIIAHSPSGLPAG
jgi:hypothetical protein